jgi:hypothetical protein
MTLGTIMDLFAGIAIVLACLGLLDCRHTLYSKRFKEIGDKKSAWCIGQQYCCYAIARFYLTHWHCHCHCDSGSMVGVGKMAPGLSPIELQFHGMFLHWRLLQQSCLL